MTIERPAIQSFQPPVRTDGAWGLDVPAAGAFRLAGPPSAIWIRASSA